MTHPHDSSFGPLPGARVLVAVAVPPAAAGLRPFIAACAPLVAVAAFTVPGARVLVAVAVPVAEDMLWCLRVLVCCLQRALSL